MYKQETENDIPMLVTSFISKPYCTGKKIHTTNISVPTFPLHQKLGVVRTLLDRCDSVTTEEADNVKEDTHIKSVLKTCGYPEWSINKSKRTKSKRKNKKNEKERKKKKRGLVVVWFPDEEKGPVLGILHRDSGHCFLWFCPLCGELTIIIQLCLTTKMK